MAPALSDGVDTQRLVRRKPSIADATTFFSEYTQDLQVARYTIWHPRAALEENKGFIEACFELGPKGSEGRMSWR